MERFGRLCAGFALACVLGGCGAATTAPVMPGDEGTSPPDTTAAQAPGANGPIGTILGGVRGLLTRSVALVGELGAGVDNGRWHAVVPPTAIQGDAQVSIGISSPMAGECVIEVTPPDKNKFDVPDTVRVDCRTLGADRLAKSVLFEWDGTAQKWIAVPGSTVDASSRSVSAPVDHFGRYTVGPEGGKAGW
jgi:hypothetical protein